jgi:hypothetical protein
VDFAAVVLNFARHYDVAPLCRSLALVNDLEVRLGPELFSEFLDYFANRTVELAAIETPRLTRAWEILR